MKKLKLNKANFFGAQSLSREQLKKVMGAGDEFTSPCLSDDCSGGGGGGGESPKIRACKGYKEGDPCSFEYNGNPSYGWCTAKLAPSYTMHCSNLRL